MIVGRASLQASQEIAGMKSLSFLLLALSVSFYYTDIEASNGFQSIFLPFVDFLLLCALSLWVAGRTGWKTVSRHDGGFLGFFDGGGDGGCD